MSDVERPGIGMFQIYIPMQPIQSRGYTSGHVTLRLVTWFSFHFSHVTAWETFPGGASGGERQRTSSIPEFPKSFCLRRAERAGPGHARGACGPPGRPRRAERGPPGHPRRAERGPPGHPRRAERGPPGHLVAAARSAGHLAIRPPPRGARATWPPGRRGRQPPV